MKQPLGWQALCHCTAAWGCSPSGSEGGSQKQAWLEVLGPPAAPAVPAEHGTHLLCLLRSAEGEVLPDRVEVVPTTVIPTLRLTYDSADELYAECSPQEEPDVFALLQASMGDWGRDKEARCACVGRGNGGVLQGEPRDGCAPPGGLGFGGWGSLEWGR